MSDFDIHDFHGEHLYAGTEDFPQFEDGFAHHSDLPELADLGDHQQYDLIGADPDEDGLWDQLMVDMHDGANPYAAG